VQRQLVESSIIRSIGYDAANLVLQIEFTRGIIRDYEDVPVTVFEEMMNARSKGKFYLKNIKNNFDFVQH
jgi:hypothetical protein